MSIAVVIPCYRVQKHILGVLEKIPDVVTHIYCVDDACPDKSGDLIEKDAKDKRIKILRHEENQGVGGAMVTGYRAALEDKNQIIIKLDGDGQMDPRLIPQFIAPIQSGECDYAKGNRFY